MFTEFEIIGAVFVLLLMRESLKERNHDSSEFITYICTQGRALAAIQGLVCIVIVDLLQSQGTNRPPPLLPPNDRPILPVASTPARRATRACIMLYLSLSAAVALLITIVSYICDLYVQFGFVLDFTWFFLGVACIMMVGVVVAVYVWITPADDRVVV